MGTKVMPPCLKGKNPVIYLPEPAVHQAKVRLPLKPHPCWPPLCPGLLLAPLRFPRRVFLNTFHVWNSISGSAFGQPDLRPWQELLKSLHYYDSTTFWNLGWFPRYFRSVKCREAKLRKKHEKFKHTTPSLLPNPYPRCYSHNIQDSLEHLQFLFF